MYEAGQKLNIGYYGGFHQQKLIKAEAKITAVCPVTGMITILISLPGGGTRKMFGYKSELKDLEDNFRKEV